MTFPIWMYVVVAGIFFSAFMTVRTSKAEREAEMSFIEQEGEVYMQRLEEERKKRGLQENEEYEMEAVPRVTREQQ
ncbi:MAG TPA: sporulation YhaL family protein [Chondromyces sp.]|nr:sporulation YhaL family protein [Chondromyces sp.]